MITPDVCQQVLDKQAVQKSQHDQSYVLMLVTVLEKYGITSFLSDGTIRLCHIDQIRRVCKN